jgi:peptide/nickel transport system permease protein
VVSLFLLNAHLIVRQNHTIDIKSSAWRNFPLRLITSHIVPNIAAILIVQASLTVAASILLESGLSFLGLGVIPPTPSWGLMIGAARSYMYQSPLYLVWPSLVIALTVLAVNTFGDALRDVLDPRLKR